MIGPAAERPPSSDPEVRLEPVAPGGAQRGRAAAAGVAAMVGIGLLAAAIGGSNPPPPGPADPPAASASPSIDRPAALPSIPSLTLEGAPAPVFYRPRGGDLEILTWTAGEAALRSARLIPGALGGRSAGDLVFLLSPDARSALVRTAGPASDGEPGSTWIAATKAGIVWQEDEVTTPAQGAWSPLGGWVAVPVTAERWELVGLAAGDVTRRVHARGIFGPWFDSGAFTRPVVAPIGFSADGRWVYGASLSSAGAAPRPAIRVSAEDGSVEGVVDFPSLGPDRLLPTSPSAPLLDPATGRSIDTAGFLLGSGRAVTITAHEPDGAIAFRYPATGLLGAAWAGDGRLLLLDADAFPDPNTVQLIAISADGTAEPPLLSTGPGVTAGGIIGARDGYVLFGFSAEGPERRILAVLLRLADGQTATLELAEDELAGLQVASWQP